MKLDWDLPLQTASGKPVRVIATNRRPAECRTQSVVILIDNGPVYGEQVFFVDDQGHNSCGSQLVFNPVQAPIEVGSIWVYKSLPARKVQVLTTTRPSENHIVAMVVSEGSLFTYSERNFRGSFNKEASS